MQKKFLTDFQFFILFIGITLRVVLFLTSPPNNSFDDHIEVINIYANTFKQPLPSQCWECYQPPVYYYLGAVVFKVSKWITSNNLTAWKVVQLINPILSILVLILFYKILKLLIIPLSIRNLSLSFVAVLPVDLFTSSMVGNDYLLVFASIISFYYFLLNKENSEQFNKITIKNFLHLTIFVTIAALTKQHGLLLLILPASILFKKLIEKERKTYSTFFPIFVLCVILSFSNELWKYNKTGMFMVSNQDFFDYTKDQFPGSLKKIEFTNLRLNALFREPFISEKTAASLPTEIFARTFFDYEYRFLSPKIPFANILGRIAYIIGLIWIIYIVSTIIIALKAKEEDRFRLRLEHLIDFIPFVLGILFLLVPVLQTFRFPFFSSMKATFCLPGIIIMLALHSRFIQRVKLNNTLSFVFIFLNISFGILLISSIILILPLALHHLHGPLWYLPL